MSAPRYWVVTPKTWRSGPGHRSHLTRDTKKEKGKKALCRVDNNARGLELSHWPGGEPLTLQQIEGALDRGEWKHGRRPTCRKLCGNCRSIANSEERVNDA